MKVKIKDKIKNKLLEFYTKRILKKRKGGKIDVIFEKAKSFGIICKYEDLERHKIILDFVTKLRKLGKIVKVICFLEDDNTKNYDFSFSSFNYDDIKISGKIVDKDINEFVKTNFDYLYYICFEINPIMGYLLAKSYAKCKIGYFEKMYTNYFDIMVNFKKKYSIKDYSMLMDQMLFYTKLLNN